MRVCFARRLLSPQPNIRGEATRHRSLRAFVLTRPTAPRSSPWLLRRDSSSGLLNPRLLALQPPVCPASCNLSLFTYPPGEHNANQPRPTLAPPPGNPRQVSIPLRDLKKKKERARKETKTRPHAACRCSVQLSTQKKVCRASRHRRPDSLPTHVLIVSTCLQLCKHTSVPYSTRCDWDLADSQLRENGSRSCRKRKSDGQVKNRGGFRGSPCR